MTAPIMSRFDLFFILVDECNEVIDYAVARRIVDLHAKLEESVERVYSRAEISKYISFARAFKPKIAPESLELLVEQYRHLRQRDFGAAAKSSWKITVRQLESMIRLAESMARMHCSDEVLPKHVRESYRLLNKSIVRVDQPDIQLEEEEEEEEQQRAPEESAAAKPEAVVEEADDVAAQKGKKKMKLSFESYKAMSNLLLMHMRKKESEMESGDSQGLKRSDVVTWYLEECISDEIESQEELVEKKFLVEKVIDRLTYNDNVIIPLHKTGLKSDQKGASDEEMSEDPILIVHPNYVI